MRWAPGYEENLAAATISTLLQCGFRMAQAELFYSARNHFSLRSQNNSQAVQTRKCQSFASRSPFFQVFLSPFNLLFWKINLREFSSRSPTSFSPLIKRCADYRNISFSSRTSTGGCSCLSKRITADPTFGLGIKQLGGTFATIYGLAYCTAETMRRSLCSRPDLHPIRHFFLYHDRNTFIGTWFQTTP